MRRLPPGISQLTRRGFLAASAAGAGVAAGILTPAARAAAAPGVTVDPLGAPLADVLLIGGTVAPGPDGRPALWSAASGEPATLNAIDPATGHTVSSQNLPGAPGSYAVVADGTGTVYVGAYSTGQLYRRRPGTGSPVENLGRPLASETYIWRLAVAEDGRLYGGTYPGGKLFGYHPATGEVRDYGQLVPGMRYVRSVAVWDGKIYAGTQPDAHLVEVDIATGARREIPLPPEVGDPAGQTVYDLNAHTGWLYARVGHAIDGTLAAYHIGRGEWTGTVPHVAGLDVSAPGAGGEVYLTAGGELVAYDPRTGSVRGTGLRFGGRVVNNRGIGWVDLDDPAWPGRTLVGLLWRGAMFRYNPVTGRSSLTTTDVPGEPIPLASLHAGASGTLYAGGYLNGGLATVDPDTGQPAFHRFAQTESILEIDGQVYLGAYPDSRFYRYHPARPWSSPEYAPGPPGTPDNPVKLVDLKAYDQVRARASTDAGDKVVYGTMPNTTLGGTLVLVDKSTGAHVVHRPVVTDQSIVSLAYAAGVAVGGTSIHGGYSVPPPTRAEARLFGWDVASDRKRYEVTPVPGAEAVPALATDSSGVVWGLANGQLFAVDPVTGEVTRRIRLAPDAPSGRVVGQLGYHAVGQTLYALVQGHLLYRIDVTAGEPTPLLDRPARHLAVHPDGRLFLGDGHQLYRVTVTG